MKGSSSVSYLVSVCSYSDSYPKDLVAELFCVQDVIYSSKTLWATNHWRWRFLPHLLSWFGVERCCCQPSNGYDGKCLQVCLKRLLFMWWWGRCRVCNFQKCPSNSGAKIHQGCDRWSSSSYFTDCVKCYCITVLVCALLPLKLNQETREVSVHVYMCVSVRMPLVCVNLKSSIAVQEKPFAHKADKRETSELRQTWEEEGWIVQDKWNPKTPPDEE